MPSLYKQLLKKLRKLQDWQGPLRENISTEQWLEKRRLISSAEPAASLQAEQGALGVYLLLVITHTVMEI